MKMTILHNAPTVLMTYVVCACFVWYVFFLYFLYQQTYRKLLVGWLTRAIVYPALWLVLIKLGIALVCALCARLYDEDVRRTTDMFRARPPRR